jgi:DNA-binding MarR family transcriptional regulator
MVDRLIHVGLVCRTPDPQNRRRVQLTITAEAEPIVGDTDLNTARRLQTLLNAMSPQTRRHLIDTLIDTIRRSADDNSPGPGIVIAAGLGWHHGVGPGGHRPG